MSDNPFKSHDSNYNVNLSTGAATPSQDLIKETTTADFARDVIAESKKQPVLVDFWAPWCGPCKQLTPIIEKAVNDAKGAVKLVKMNIDDHPSIAGQLGVQSIPAVFAFVDGRPIDGFMGAQPESEIKKFIAKITGGEKQEMIEQAVTMADGFVQSGDIIQAINIYSQILQQAPDTVAAIAGLANCLLQSGDSEKAKAILATTPENKKDDPLIRSVETTIALNEQIALLGDPAELEKRLDANPKDHQARFDLALIYNAQGERQKAADALFAIMKADRLWHDDGARKQLLQFFEAWGPMDAATINARRQLSSLLFS